jgi:hypothetical protein
VPNVLDLVLSVELRRGGEVVRTLYPRRGEVLDDRYAPIHSSLGKALPLD